MSSRYAAEFLRSFVALVARNDFPFGLPAAHAQALRVAALDELPAVGCFG